jgi:glycosyltransferase involved in cell wall biosynthesis
MVAEGTSEQRAPAVLLLGPARTAPSGVATHLNQLFGSALAERFQLSQFQVGSEGRSESGGGAALRLFFSPLALIVRLVRLRPRIVHINTSLDFKGYWRDLAYLGVSKALGRRVVYQIHGGALPEEFFPRSALLRALLRRALMGSDVVVLLAEREMSAYRSFAPRARLVRIANCVRVEEGETVVRTGSAPVLSVAYLGRLTMSKGILETIEAVGILRDRGIEVSLTIAGSGEAADLIRRSVTARNLQGQVQLVGELFGEAKRELWQRTDVLALPSYHEGLPYALLEAMAAGVVPVASPVGAIPDVMQDRVHGLIVPARDPQAVARGLGELAADRELLRRLGRAARERIASGYSLTRLAAQFTELYQSLLAPAGRR